MSETERVKSNNKNTVRRRIRLIGHPKKAEKIKIRYLLVALAVLGVVVAPSSIVEAVSCPSLRVVFARGSGGEHNADPNYLDFKSTIEAKLKTTNIEYEFIDLDYPAVGVGLDNLVVSLGALIGAGDAYEFGESVKTGSKNLVAMVNGNSCPNTRYVVGGYSQGAMVISRSLNELNPNRLIYAATFGDPKIYLPEGEGIIPPACRGDNLSDYRAYVPDCQAYKGLLGSYIPYEPESLIGKVGTWCNKRDIFCSSKVSISDHLGYISESLYEDASRIIFDKITKNFGVENNISSPHDTAILIDSTGSMQSMIKKYKAEAYRLAKETLESGGRVALYDYRDLADPYSPVKRCGFDDCDLEKFESGLEKIRAANGGDAPESLLSASMHVMTDLNWKYGSTKSLVILTDANFLAPDRDGMTFDEVVSVSKKIDPVNFYVITTAKYSEYYNELAEATDGKVVTNFDELSLLTDFIMERYDSLPRVEESSPEPIPTLEILSSEEVNGTMGIEFKTNAPRVLVSINDKILGVTEESKIIIKDLNFGMENTVSLTPLGEEVRGETKTIKISAKAYGGEPFFLPKAPNSGKR